MARSTLKGFWRQKPTTAATPAQTLMGFTASFDPTSATPVLLGTLPKGAFVHSVVSHGGATGGTNPTVDIGTSADDDGFANEMSADTADIAVAAGALALTKLTEDTGVFGKVGASAATGGTTTVSIFYFMDDA